VEWIEVAHNREQWYEPMNMVMTFMCHKIKLIDQLMASNISEDGS